MTVITEIGNHVPPLYKSICADENLEKVEIFWPQYKSKEHKEDIYFIHKLWPVKIRSVELFFPNVKDRQFEKYGHLAKIVFRYHWIEWKYVQGNRIFKGEWPSFESEGILDDKKRAEAEEIMNAPMSDTESAFLDYWESKNAPAPKNNDESMGNVTLRLPIDPDAPESQDEKFTLESADKSYSSTKTVKDDQVPGNNTLELEFKGVKAETKYIFTIDHGKDGDAVTVFENVPGRELKEYA